MKKYIAAPLLFIIGLLVGSFLSNHSFENCPTALHYSYFSTKSFFEDAYRDMPSAHIATSNIRGILVNHHLFASHLIAETITKIATTSPVTVLLISPNHFSAGKNPILSSVYQWETPYGVLENNCRLIRSLEAKGVLAIEEAPFEKEHGISGIVAFIKKSLPNARIVPLIVKNHTPPEKIMALASALHAASNNQTLIIGSFDFSHYVTDAVAQKQDKESLEIIKNFDYVRLHNAKVDSLPGLEIFLRYVEMEGAKRFELIANTNSAQLLNNPTTEETTSYINGAFSQNILEY